MDNIQLNDILKPVFANKFCINHIKTVGDFMAIAGVYGLREVPHPQYRHDLEPCYKFGRGGPMLRNLGTKSWQELLSALDRIGVEWRKYVRHYPSPGTLHITLLPAEPASLEVYQPEVVRMAEKMAEVLQFYADRANFNLTRCLPGGLVPANSEVDHDYGKRAREVLEEWKNVKQLRG